MISPAFFAVFISHGGAHSSKAWKTAGDVVMHICLSGPSKDEKYELTLACRDEAYLEDQSPKKRLISKPLCY